MHIQPAIVQTTSPPEVDFQQKSEGCSFVETIKTVALLFFGACCSFIGSLALYQLTIADAFIVALPCFLTTGLVLWKILHRTQTPIATIEETFRSQVKEHALALMQTLEPLKITQNYSEEQNRYTETLETIKKFHEDVADQVSCPLTPRKPGTLLSPSVKNLAEHDSEIHDLLNKLNHGRISFKELEDQVKAMEDIWQKKVTEMNKGHSQAIKEMSEWLILARKELRYLTEEQLDLSDGPLSLSYLFTKPGGLLLLFPNLLLPLKRFQDQSLAAFSERQHALGRT